MVENEFKIMLTKAQYEAVHALYSWDSEAEQVNWYYESADGELSRRHITCRVRAVGGKRYLQVKLPAHENSNGAVSRVELEQELAERDGVPQSISGEELERISGAADLPDAALMGSLATFRSVLHFEGGEIDLDRSSYFGKTDYELEIEYTDEGAAERILAEIQQHVEVDRSAPVTGKIRRFLAEYEKNHL